MISHDWQTQMLLDIEDDVDLTNDRNVPRKVFVGESSDGQTHFCYKLGMEGFLAAFQSPNVGRMVAANACSTPEQIKGLNYREIEFNEALAISIAKQGIVGVLFFFNEEQYKRVYNDGR